MCGFIISKNPTENKLDHRGISKVEIKYQDWFIEFNSLPLSSNQTGIQQPISFKHGYLVFNGEIFNYKELLPSALSDVHYLQQTFTKLNFSIHDLYKESIHWDGFWSIAYVSFMGDVHMFTDWLGKKQLYFSELGIASEIKPILPKGSLRLNYDIHLFGTHNTPFEKVNRCIPGALYVYKPATGRAHNIMHQNYWIKPKESNLYNIIDKSVKQRLENRIDGVSLFLSGGLDSNIILHHLLKYTKDFEAISIDNGERQIVEQIEKELNVEVKYIKDSYTEEDIIKSIYHYEHPLDYGSLIPNYILFKECSNAMVLTGDGSDELFGGYNRAKESNTWDFDVNYELPYYHNIRLDRTSMAFTKEARSPLMGMEVARYAYYAPRIEKVNKAILRATYSNLLPQVVLNAKKQPLRLNNDKQFNKDLVKKYFNIVFE